MKDYYAILGVDPVADADAIKRAYRTLARRYHPDRNKAAEAEERFKEVGEAYAVLSDPEQRQQYDRARQLGAGAGFRGGFSADADGVEIDSELFNEIFSRIFRGEATRGHGAEPFGADPFGADLFGGPPHGFAGAGMRPDAQQESPAIDLELSLEEAHAGTLRTLAVADPVSGETLTRRVRIPAGARPGQIVRIPLAPGRPPLRVRVRWAPHADYVWEGDQLVRNLMITPWEAALGTTVTLDTLAGRVALRVPPGSDAGRTLRVAGKGLAGGDLLVRIAVRAPAATTGEQRRAYEALQRSFEQYA